MKPCAVEGCSRKRHARGFCGPHYHRLARYGDPLGSKPRGRVGTNNHARRPLAERLWAKVDRSGGPDACWPWTGAVNAGTKEHPDARAYGVIGVGERSEGVALVHRVAFELAVGPIPEGLDVDHVCRNRLCCNPSPLHLEAVTHAENVRRGNAPSAVASREQRCKRGHAYSEFRYVSPGGHGQCGECRRLRRLGAI